VQYNLESHITCKARKNCYKPLNTAELHYFDKHVSELVNNKRKFLLKEGHCHHKPMWT